LKQQGRSDMPEQVIDCARLVLVLWSVSSSLTN
jgi:hypothetical protein